MNNTKKAKTKRLLCLLLTLAMVFGILPAMSRPVSAYTGNGDLISDPFLVDTYDELRQVMKTRAWMSDTTNDSATYITLNSDILIEDSTSDYYLETFNAESHNLYINLNGHSLIRRTDSSDNYMFDVKCHLMIADRKGGGTIRFKTTASDDDTAVFFDNTSGSWLEIFDDVYVVNDTAENSDYTNCGVLSRGYGDIKIFASECWIAAQLPIKMSGNGVCYVNGASLGSTSSSSYVALDVDCKRANIYNCTAYGDITIHSSYTGGLYTVFDGTTIYRNGIQKDFSSIIKFNVYSGTIPANGGVLTVTDHEDPFIANIDITDVAAPYGNTKIGDFTYTVATENVIGLGVTFVNSSGIAMSGNKQFVGGEDYKYYIHVMPKGGYMFKANAITGVSTGTINGESVETVTHPSFYSGMGTDIRLISTFTAVPTVTAFSATVTEPVVGNVPCFTAVPGNSTEYTSTVLHWEEKIPGANYTTYMSEDSAFQYGCIYNVYVKFELKEGYVTPGEITDLPGTINSQTGSQVAPQKWNYALYVISFTMPDAPVPEKYITVYYGDARNSSGYIINKAAPGTKVTLTSDDPDEGEVFDYWYVRDNMVSFEDPHSPTTTFIMPDSSVTIVARYKDENAVVLNGWQKEDGKWYLYSNNEKLTGWQKDNGNWYYLNKEGIMLTGWIQDGGKWYYMRTNGAMATGWVHDGGKWYYMNANGAMATGWIQDGGKWYYMSSSGAMMTGWVSDGGKWYYMNANGAMVTGWIQDGGKWYFLEANGVMATNKWINGTYYVKSNGEMAVNEWVDGGKYYVGADGKWVPNKTK